MFYLFKALCEYVVDPVVVGEGATVPGGYNPDDSVSYRQYTQEQHREQQCQVEVVRAGCPEHHLREGEVVQ